MTLAVEEAKKRAFEMINEFANEELRGIDVMIIVGMVASIVLARLPPDTDVEMEFRLWSETIWAAIRTMRKDMQGQIQ